MRNQDVIKKAKVFLQYAKENDFYTEYAKSFCLAHGIPIKCFRQEFLYNAIREAKEVGPLTWRNFLSSISLSFPIAEDKVYGKEYWAKVIEKMKQTQNSKRYE